MPESPKDCLGHPAPPDRGSATGDVRAQGREAEARRWGSTDGSALSTIDDAAFLDTMSETAASLVRSLDPAEPASMSRTAEWATAQQIARYLADLATEVAAVAALAREMRDEPLSERDRALIDAAWQRHVAAHPAPTPAPQAAPSEAGVGEADVRLTPEVLREAVAQLRGFVVVDNPGPNGATQVGSTIRSPSRAACETAVEVLTALAARATPAAPSEAAWTGVGLPDPNTDLVISPHYTRGYEEGARDAGKLRAQRYALRTVNEKLHSHIQELERDLAAARADGERLREHAEMSDGCLAMIREDLVALLSEEAMKHTPPMFYNDAMRAAVAKARAAAAQEGV